MILCVNPNAAIDKTVVVNEFRLNVIQRPEQVLAFPGGKGCNVARALKTLGGQPVVTGWVGGFAGQFIESGLHDEGIDTAFVQTDFESRTCLSILDPASNTLTELYEKGDAVPGEKVAEFAAWFRSHVSEYEAVTFSGSLPPGVPLSFYRDMIAIAHQAKVPVLLDSSGEALRQGVTAKPLLVKPNETELADLAGIAPQDQPWHGLPGQVPDVARAARELSYRYETLAVISIGAEGAVAANHDQVWHIRPPQVTIKSAVGSGDCTLAGITFGLTHRFTVEDAVKYGVAAGTANALTAGAGHFSVSDFESVLAHVTVEQLAGGAHGSHYDFG